MMAKGDPRMNKPRRDAMEMINRIPETEYLIILKRSRFLKESWKMNW